MQRLRKMVSPKKTSVHEVKKQLKPCSYYIKGSFKITGPAKISNNHLSTLCAAIIVETFLKRNYPSNTVSAIYLDFYNAALAAQKKSKNSLPYLTRWESHVEVKRFINVPCIPIDAILFNKKTKHTLRFISEQEETIQVDFDFFIATGDNSHLLFDYLIRQGYTHRKLSNVPLNEFIDRLLNSEHQQLNHRFESIAQNMAVAVSAKSGSKLQIEWNK
ncbi:hypothetical protein [Hymenopteran rhabdo-related virus 23]|uniref:Uncharacterized protein n=1 Tax=Hymenopteran rhabdo-related virus 23 TaxID=2847804 RepID=A0AAE9GVX5_9RHAB|nr:hypothetical protein QKT06_gp3 [Hymenopteran rhabdo-related virus]UOS86041.1 hypothetical protein [Hymenopteran rhabdo-related virus 23]